MLPCYSLFRLYEISKYRKKSFPGTFITSKNIGMY